MLKNNLSTKKALIPFLNKKITLIPVVGTNAELKRTPYHEQYFEATLLKVSTKKATYVKVGMTTPFTFNINGETDIHYCAYLAFESIDELKRYLELSTFKEQLSSNKFNLDNFSLESIQLIKDIVDSEIIN